MKKVISVYILLLLFFITKAQEPIIFTGKIDVKNAKAGNDASFVGKVGNNYLFASSNPTGIGGGKYFENNPPKLYLIDKDGNLITSTNLKEQFNNAKISDFYLYDVITFKEKIVCLYSSYEKSEKSKIFYLAEINPKSLSADLKNSKFISKELSYSMIGIIVTTPLVLWNVSEDKTKLAVSFSRYYHPKVLPKDRPKTKYALLKSFVYDNNLNILSKNSFEVEPEKYFYKFYESYDMKVNNNGEVITLLKYNIKQDKGPDAISSSLHITNQNNNIGKIIDIKLPNDLLIRDNSVLNVDENNIVVTGMPSILEKNTYGLVVHNIIGYINKTYNYNGEEIGSSIIPFTNFEVDFPVIKGRDYKKQIDYKGTIVLNDGSYLMISQLFKADIILALYNKEGKQLWTKLINRKMSWDTFLGTFHKEATDDVYIIFNDSEDGVATYFVKVDKEGNLSNKKEITRGSTSYYGKQADATEYVYHTTKNDIKYGIIKF